VPLDARRVGETRYAFLWSTDRFEPAFVLPFGYDLIISDSDRAVRRTITVPETGFLDLGDIELRRR